MLFVDIIFIICLKIIQFSLPGLSNDPVGNFARLQMPMDAELEVCN